MIDSLSLLVKNHEERIARVEAQNNIIRNESADVILEQNNPNPFAETTTITYYVPETVTGTTELVISHSARNEVLRTIQLTKGTPTQLTVSANGLTTGVYVYSIVVANKVLASKKFIIIK
ncbi:MAG: hypothetical protein JNL32_03385 [Candidatus Kapabacteria bacterium]|nr:hypothetical protein [Candidatus Kapabacteria bacterium]